MRQACASLAGRECPVYGPPLPRGAPGWRHSGRAPKKSERTVIPSGRGGTPELDASIPRLPAGHSRQGCIEPQTACGAPRGPMHRASRCCSTRSTRGCTEVGGASRAPRGSVHRAWGCPVGRSALGASMPDLAAGHLGGRCIEGRGALGAVASSMHRWCECPRGSLELDEGEDQSLRRSWPSTRSNRPLRTAASIAASIAALAGLVRRRKPRWARVLRDRSSRV